MYDQELDGFSKGLFVNALVDAAPVDVVVLGKERDDLPLGVSHEFRWAD